MWEGCWHPRMGCCRWGNWGPPTHLPDRRRSLDMCYAERAFAMTSRSAGRGTPGDSGSLVDPAATAAGSTRSPAAGTAATERNPQRIAAAAAARRARVTVWPGILHAGGELDLKEEEKTKAGDKKVQKL
eukprot:TRINITY_DN33859_c0_g1_i1.p4 TRINITY_DN33859_c0_g1~~TRINITY_DN33859_c0_g1_i1.p4  ORF type:complete len:129 (-),score=3.75 TRINITY_DN33859_c0_g1_i1:5-391(-)